MAPYSRLKLSDFYTVPQTKLFEHHSFRSETYPYSLYMEVPQEFVGCICSCN